MLCPRPEHLAFASPIACTNSGSRPLGNAPAWRETTYVPLPAAMGPVLSVAHAASTKGMTKTNADFKLAPRMFTMSDKA